MRGIGVATNHDGVVEVLLLGVYGLLALFGLARLILPSVNATTTAFQVLQGDPAGGGGRELQVDPAGGGGRELQGDPTGGGGRQVRRSLILGEAAWNPLKSLESRKDRVGSNNQGYKPQQTKSGGYQHQGYKVGGDQPVCQPLVLYVLPLPPSRDDTGLLWPLLAGIPALLGALATGAPTYIFNRND